MSECWRSGRKRSRRSSISISSRRRKRRRSFHPPSPGRNARSLETRAMDLSVTYLSIGAAGSCSSACSFPSNALFPWMMQNGSPPSLHELPLVSQLSPPQVDKFYPFFPAHGFVQLACQPAQEMNSEDDDFSADKEKELPLLWQSKEQSCGSGMDCLIWSNLPHDLVERVIAFLHVPDAIRTCIVSKQWSTITSSPNFLRTCAESHNGGSFVLIFRAKSKLQTTWLAAYDWVARRWYSITLNFLPSPPAAPFMNYTVVSVSGGLLCLLPEPRKTWKSVGFVVCNPVTRHWKELPCRSHDSKMPDLVAMSVDNARRTYRILVLTDFVLDVNPVVATELYDSRSGKWTLTGVERSSGGKFKSTAVSGSVVFCVYEETSQWHTIRVYDMEDQQWKSSLSLPTFFYETQEVIETPDILDCSGSLLLVGRFGKHSCREEVVIWELDSSVSGVDSWREVDRMPQDIAREFLGCLVFGHYYCISRGDLIFFIASFRAPMLVYNLVERTWTWWAWPYYEKYASRFPVFGFVKMPLSFPPFGFAFDLRFDVPV